MPYLNLDLDYFNHPKIVRLVAMLGAEHIAMPIKLWCYVGKFHCETGMLQGYSKHDIEVAVGWNGPKELLINTFLDPKICLLEENQKGYKVHDWFDHAGHLKAFKKRAKTAAKKRWKKDATSIPQACLTSAPTLPSLPALPKEEKKKKEYMSAVADAESLLMFLSEKVGRVFRARSPQGKPTANLEFIMARLRDGADLQTCRTLIARKVRDWQSDPKMQKYLRPETLFNRTKFESYLAEVTPCGTAPIAEQPTTA